MTVFDGFRAALAAKQGTVLPRCGERPFLWIQSSWSDGFGRNRSEIGGVRG